MRRAWAIVLWGLAQAATAAWPERPVRLVVPAAPGGAIDVVGRIMSPKMGELLGQNIVIDNRTGANNIIGTEIVARSAADGYTMLITAGAHTVNPSVYRKLPYDAIRDFAPLIHLCNSGGLVVVVHPAFPAKTLQQLIDAAKASPGRIVYGSGGIGNSTHLAGELFNLMAGVQLTHVPYKGAGPATTDLLGGQIPLMFGASPTVVPMVKAGRLRALGFTGLERSPQLPDVPTVDEQGVKGYEVNGWYGMYLPARTPKVIVTRLNAVANSVLKTAEVRERMAGLNLAPVGGTPEAFGAFLRADIEKYARIVKAAGIEPQ
jgi:tripartite-type tricarboxylate transporter receptor subunit TctC